MDGRSLLAAPRLRARRVMFALGIVLLAAACDSSTSGVGTPPPNEGSPIVLPSGEPTPATTGSAGASPGATPAGTASGTTTVRAYFVLGSFIDNAGLVPVVREIPKTNAVGAAAMQALLEGPNQAELGARPAMYTNVPVDTRFLGLTIANGIATVNLSKEFESGGDSASVLGRLAQVVYTLTQFPTVTSVSFEIDGVPKTDFGAGAMLDGPVGRADFTAELPAIFVDRPAWGGILGNPARLVGVANVFEAKFTAEFVDKSGRTMATAPVMASCGSGCWGAFDVTIPYNVGSAGWGTLLVFEPSAKDGSPTKTTEYPVWLAP